MAAARQRVGKYPITQSHPESFDNEKYFQNGDSPDTAYIHGPSGAVCTFFDDQQLKLDASSPLTVSLNREADWANPVIVDLVYDRLGVEDHGNGVYTGHEDDFDWILLKNAKASWVEKTLGVVGTVADLTSAAIKEVGGNAQWTEYANVGGRIVKWLNAKIDTPGRSKYSRVDNVSSLCFGSVNVWASYSNEQPRAGALLCSEGTPGLGV